MVPWHVGKCFKNTKTMMRKHEKGYCSNQWSNVHVGMILGIFSIYKISNQMKTLRKGNVIILGKHVIFWLDIRRKHIYLEANRNLVLSYLGSPMCCCSIVFMALSCEKCWLMSVCRTMSMQRLRNSRNSVFCMWEKMLQSCSWIILKNKRSIIMFQVNTWC